MTTASGDEGDLRTWFEHRIPEGWTQQPPEITVDGDQATVNVLLEPVDVPEGMPGKARKKTFTRQISSWRKKTRKKREEIAAEARNEHGLDVVWAATIEDHSRSFTGKRSSIKAKLGKAELSTLDAMVAAGAAGSQQEALGVCVRLAGQHQDEWQPGPQGEHRSDEGAL